MYHNKNKMRLNEYQWQAWVTDRAWISGLAGAVSVVLCAVYYSFNDVLVHGLYVFGFKITHHRQESLLVALFMISGMMLFAELLRLRASRLRPFISPLPGLSAGKVIGVFFHSIIEYCKVIIIFWLVIVFYQWVEHYGFKYHKPYYQDWFYTLDVIWVVLLWGGVPYIFFTKLLQHNVQLDKKNISILLDKSILALYQRMLVRKKRSVWTRQENEIFRSLLVKIFFAPLMTLFFFDQFPHLVANVNYVLEGIPSAIKNGQYSHDRLNSDLFNVFVALIFSIDVALAWCGYMVSSRWLDNQTTSTEPTLKGWLVCVCCYPPFQFYLGLYFAAPGERELMSFSSQIAITIFTLLMIVSYFFYTSATLWFGVRFSNLTHRGIIRKGPYSLVRHPAYASKNFAWWCVMFPTIIYNGLNTGVKVAIAQILGLCLMSLCYYFRAMTEEQHLSKDPCYIDYCKQVRFRFIPGVI